MSKTRYPFIFIRNVNENISYSPPGSGRDNQSNFPIRTRKIHGERLTNKLNEIWLKFQNDKEERQAISLSTRDGHYLEFRSKAGYELVTKSLENIPKKIRISNIRVIKEHDEIVTIATVYIPAGEESFFIAKIRDYLDPDKNSVTGKFRNQKLVNSIEDIRIAILESFWQDDNTLIPSETSEWCEIWLRTEIERNVYKEFQNSCSYLSIELKEGFINFPERLVVLAKANREQLKELIEQTDYLAEIRKARETIEFFLKLSNIEQADWVKNLKDRLVVNKEANTAICILDTGVNNGHQLINPVLKDEDMHSFDSEWGVTDHLGHGTHMSGVAIFGDVSAALQHSSIIELNHVLESGKILPPTGLNEPELYGHITQRVVAYTEIQAPKRNRIICMAVSVEDAQRGRPSSWSGAIDALTSGAEDDKKRLFILASGNNQDDFSTYPDTLSAAQSPSQSWNALAVGAYTNLVQINDPNLVDYNTIAPAGGLSPFSTTSLTWEKAWPIKPEVLFEGGNVAIDSTNFATECDDLSVLTTHHKPLNSQFEAFRMTSAATAKAAWMAAQIQSQYPAMWPETIRGLMVHSANWTKTMKRQFLGDKPKKSNYLTLLRTCGYGVPNLEKALYCSKNSLTLIAEEIIQPFEKKKNSSTYRSKDMHFYEIPWPKDALLDLGNTEVKMRVTLSYFIEPGPGEIGWKDRYRYRSHGLKFDINNTNETKEEFVKRVNKAARAEDEKKMKTSNDSDRWTIGSQNRHLGSVHSDMIEGTAAELSTCNFIGVSPVIGWWKERTHLKKWNKKARYSLIISIETPEVEVDLYTPIANKLKIPIEIVSV